MIFVTVGTHQQPFNRLLEAVDALALDEECIFQTGHCTYMPRGQAMPFMPFEEMQQHMSAARVVICHAGTGTVVSALRAGKCPVVAPRLVRFGEHVDDHQLELVQSFAGLIVPYMPGDDLAACITEAGRKTGQRQIGPAPALIEHLHQAILDSARKRISR